MGSLSLPSDAVARVPLIFLDQFKRPAAVATSGTLTFDSKVVKAVLSEDGASVTITPLVDSGTTSIGYANGGLTDSLSVSISVPVPATVSFDADHATLTAKDTSAAGAA